MSLVVRKPAFCICENKAADQLCGNRTADQRLCFRYIDCTIPLLPKSEISSIQPSSVAVQPGLCRTWSETPKTGFLTTRLKCSSRKNVGERSRFDNQSLMFIYIRCLIASIVCMSMIKTYLSKVSIKLTHLCNMSLVDNCEKTGLRGFGPGPTQTGPCSHRRGLEALNFGFRK